MPGLAKGVRINAVCPGWIRTPPVEDMPKHNPEAEKQNSFTSRSAAWVGRRKSRRLWSGSARTAPRWW